MGGSLSAVLAGIPGYAGYTAAKQRDEASSMNELQQASVLMGLQSAMQKQAREQQARSELEALGPNPTEPQLLNWASRHSGPDTLFKGLESAQLRRDTLAQQERFAKQAAADKRDARRETMEFRYDQLFAQMTRDEQTSLDRTLDRQQREAAALRSDATKRYLGMLVNQARQEGFDLRREMGSNNQFNQSVSAARLYHDTGLVAPGFMALPKNVPSSDASAYAQALAGGTAMADRQMPPEETAGMVDMPALPTAPPDNFDARDLRLRNAQPPQLPATSAPTGQPTAPQMPPTVASIPKERAKWEQAQSKPSIAGAGQLTPGALKFTAQQYLAGDRQAAQGYARNATARIALQNAIFEEAQAQGLSPQQTAAKMAEYAGITAASRTVGQRSANISLAATEAQEMIGIVQETSDKFARTNFVPWNMALRAYESGTGSPEVSEFGAALNALVNVYARAINPTGVPTVSDKEHARAVINAVQSPAQVQAVLGIINRELEIAKKAPKSVRESLRREVTGGQGGGAPKAEDFFR